MRARFGRRERGATAVEYGIMVALIAAIIIGIVGTLGGQIQAAFGQVVAGIGGQPAGDDQAETCDAQGNTNSKVLWVRTAVYTDGAQTLTNQLGTTWMSGDENAEHTLLEETWAGVVESWLLSENSGVPAQMVDIFKDGFPTRGDDGLAWSIQGTSCSHDSGHAVNPNCDEDGNYTGNQNNWWWVRHDYYEHGAYEYRDGVPVWSGNDTYSSYPIGDKGELQGTEHVDPARYYSPDGEYHPVAATVENYEHGFLVIPDEGTGFTEPYWEGAPLKYTEAEKGSFTYTDWFGTEHNDSGYGVLLPTPPEGPGTVNWQSPCSPY